VKASSEGAAVSGEKREKRRKRIVVIPAPFRPGERLLDEDRLRVARSPDLRKCRWI
jgi:hypothetical protein